MGLINKTPEERAAKDLKKFLAGPGGSAQAAFQRGDHVFQIRLDVSPRTMTDTTVTLNQICEQGWDLLSASLAFVPRSQATTGSVVGQLTNIVGETQALYVFRRRLDRAEGI